MQSFDIEKYTPDPTRPGFCLFERMATYAECQQAIENHLRSINFDHQGDKITLWDALDYFHVSGDVRFDKGFDPEKNQIPGFRYLEISAVQGSSEGHYLHVKATDADSGESRGLFLGKTFLGLKIAYEIAREIYAVLSQDKS